MRKRKISQQFMLLLCFESCQSRLQHWSCVPNSYGRRIQLPRKKAEAQRNRRTCSRGLKAVRTKLGKNVLQTGYTRKSRENMIERDKDGKDANDCRDQQIMSSGRGRSEGAIVAKVRDDTALAAVLHLFTPTPTAAKAKRGC